MFSLETKRKISDEVQRILRETNDPELPEGEIQFQLHVDGAASWSWADIRNNGFFTATNKPGVNPWNEQSKEAKEERIPMMNSLTGVSETEPKEVE